MLPGTTDGRHGSRPNPADLVSAGVSSKGALVRRCGDSPQTVVTATSAARRRRNENARDVDRMMPYSVNLLYQAERVKSDAERRQADAEVGMMAADLSRFRDDVVRFASALRRHRRTRYPAAGLAESAQPGSRCQAACSGSAAGG